MSKILAAPRKKGSPILAPNVRFLEPSCGSWRSRQDDWSQVAMFPWRHSRKGQEYNCLQAATIWSHKPSARDLRVARRRLVQALRGQRDKVLAL